MRRMCFLCSMRLALLLFATWAWAGCDTAPPADTVSTGGYRFDQPDEVWELPLPFAEISDLCMLPNGSIAFVIDEIATIYRFDPLSGTVVDSLHLPVAMDSEGLACIGDTNYILTGDGLLIRNTPDETDSLQTPFDHQNNPEGLVQDPVTGNLLLTCKGKPLEGGKGRRMVYILQIDSSQAHPEPFIEISTQEIARHPIGQQIKKSKGKGKNHDPIFRPSALGIQPGSGNLVILSASTQLIATYDRNARLVDLQPLPKHLLPKAEGICFAPDSTLYISTEAGCKGCVPKIVAYHYRNP